MSDNMEAKESEVKEYEEMEKYAFVSQRAFEYNFVGYCYREWSEIKIDSGWRFLLGDEDEDYLDNPDNSLTMDLVDVIAWMPRLEAVLPTRANCEFVWSDEEQLFEKI